MLYTHLLRHCRDGFGIGYHGYRGLRVGSRWFSLRIAYFGSDDFSVQSLKALCQLQRTDPQHVSSLEVITRSIKRSGRNLKAFADVPVGTYAIANNIPVHRADSSQDIISLLDSSNFNLAVAVSYGKLIPEKFLNEMKYGGLNVHPSLLPSYSGSSPIQYSLMNDDAYTGVSVQTLHPTKFDHGQIISQSEQIPIGHDEDFLSLRTKLADIGSKLLVETIQKGLFLNPQASESSSPYEFSLAAKIKPLAREIDWGKLSRQLQRLNHALGPIYSYIPKVNKEGKVVEKLRIILNSVEPVISSPSLLQKLGQFTEVDGRLIVKTSDGVIACDKVKLQYCAEETPKIFMEKLRKRVGHEDHVFVNG